MLILKKVIFPVLLMLCIPVASVAACACSHHRPQVPEGSACHTHAGQEPTVSDPSSAMLTVGCECQPQSMQAVFSPASAKFDKQPVAATTRTEPQIKTGIFVVYHAAVDRDTSFYAALKCGLLPQRAPPRL